MRVAFIEEEREGKSQGAIGATVRSCAWGVTAGPDHPPAGPAQGPEMVVNEHPPVAIACRAGGLEPEAAAARRFDETKATKYSLVSHGPGFRKWNT